MMRASPTPNQILFFSLRTGTVLCGLGLYFSISLLGLGLGVSILSGFCFLLFPEYRDFYLKHPLFWPSFLLISSILISILAADSYPFWGPIENTLHLCCLFFFTLCFSRFSHLPEKMRKHAPHLALFLMVVSIAQTTGIFSRAFPRLSTYVFQLPKSESFFLAVGFTRHHTTFGASLIWLFHLLFAQAWFEKSGRSRWTLFAGAVACVVGISFTFSRGAWLSLLVSWILVLFLVHWKRAIAGLLGSTLLVGLLFFSNSSFEQRIRSFEFSANQERFELWQTGWKMFLDSPWLGQGYHSYADRFERFTDLHLRTPSVPRDPHNMYLDFLATTGLFGFSAFLFFLLAIWHFLIKNWSQTPDTNPAKPWLMATLGGFSAFCVGGFFDRYFYMQHTLIPLLLFLAVCAARSPNPKVTASEKRLFG